MAIAVGGGMGALAASVHAIPSKWLAVALLAIAAPLVALVVRDLKKLILVVLLADTSLGIDIAIQNQGWHSGGPTGYLVSSGTIALLVGYTLWIAERRPSPRFVPQVTLPALIYLLVVAISFFQSPSLQLSSFGLFAKVQAFLIYIYLISHIRTEQDLTFIVSFLIALLLLQSALMLLQYFTGASIEIGGGLISSGGFAEGSGGAGVTGARVAGTLGRPGSAALFLNSMMCLAFSTYLARKGTLAKLALVAVLAGTVALVGTSSRAGWVSFALALSVMLVRLVWTPSGQKALAFILIGGLLVAVLFGGQIQKRLVTLQDDKTRERLDTMALNIIRAYPLGIGENTYDLHMSDRYAHPDMVGHRHLPVHNRYLMVWAETGPQGLLAFVLMLLAPIWQARRWLFRVGDASLANVLGTGVVGSLASYALFMRSENFNGRPEMQLLWFLIALLVAVNQMIASEQQVPSPAHDAQPRPARLRASN